MLNPTFLLAAAIDDEGCIALPAVDDGRAFPVATARFWPGEDGRFLQRVAPDAGRNGAEAGPPAPLDEAFLARCLTARLGPLTPDLFVADAGGPVQRDAAAVEARARVLRDAFVLYLTAYEERLI